MILHVEVGGICAIEQVANDVVTVLATRNGNGFGIGLIGIMVGLLNRWDDVGAR